MSAVLLSGRIGRARWALWPGAPVFDTAGNRALIPYGLIYAEPGSFNFHGVGSSLAVWDDFTALPTRPVLSPSATLFNCSRATLNKRRP